LLHRTFQLPEASLPGYPATQALYSHFSGVSLPGTPIGCDQEVPPYPPEQAAVHHVFDGGWVWVLRFNNGITSAGVAATEEAARPLRLDEGEPAWNRLLDSIPTLKGQFASARPELPFAYVPRLSFLSSRVTGRRWAMLPSAAGFIDPLATSPLIASLYANMDNFPVFKLISLLYFTAASYSETARRLGKSHLASSFLLHDHPSFGPECRQILERAMHLTSDRESVIVTRDIRQAIESIDIAGLSDVTRKGWYPVNAEDLLQSAVKLESTRDEIESMLLACGFYRAEAG
jgi:FADH2 O2-dependent halogenase